MLYSCKMLLHVVGAMSWLPFATYLGRFCRMGYQQLISNSKGINKASSTCSWENMKLWCATIPPHPFRPCYLLFVVLLFDVIMKSIDWLLDLSVADFWQTLHILHYLALSCPSHVISWQRVLSVPQARWRCRRGGVARRMPVHAETVRRHDTNPKNQKKSDEHHTKTLPRNSVTCKDVCYSLLSAAAPHIQLVDCTWKPFIITQCDKCIQMCDIDCHCMAALNWTCESYQTVMTKAETKGTAVKKEVHLWKVIIILTNEFSVLSRGTIVTSGAALSPLRFAARDREGRTWPSESVRMTPVRESINWITLNWILFENIWKGFSVWTRLLVSQK